MPDKDDFDELLNTANCTNTWTTVNGVNGRLFTSKVNGNTLFIPAAGDRFGSGLSDVGSSGLVWSRSLNASYTYHAWNLYFSSATRSATIATTVSLFAVFDRISYRIQNQRQQPLARPTRASSQEGLQVK